MGEYADYEINRGIDDEWPFGPSLRPRFYRRRRPYRRTVTLTPRFLQDLSHLVTPEPQTRRKTHA